MDEAKGKNLFRYDRVKILGKYGKPWQGVIAHAGYYGALFSSVAVGEEALFRGMLQTEIKRATGSSKMALIGQSLVFGAAHIFEPDLTVQESLVRFAWTGLLGAYMGWLYQQNSYNLGSSIAFHYWYDTLISLVDYILNPQNGALCFQINFVRKSW
jgi:membrane protease YdiL (CAAX protease family)